MITVEDILEEIVGEIEDEYDQEHHEDRIRELPAHALEVDARVRIRELNELLETELPEDEEYDTIGGFVMAQLGRVPSEGEELRYENVQIKILRSNDRSVQRVLLEPRDSKETQKPR